MAKRSWFKQYFKNLSKKNIDLIKIKRLAFIITILGLFLIFALSLFVKPIIIDPCSLPNTKENTYVQLSGLVSSDIILSKNFKLLIIKNGSCEAEITCNCPSDSEFKGKEIIILGKVEIYKDKKQINANRIENA